MTTKQMSVRIGLLCALLMGLFLLTSYRATLNAFLAVKLYSIPISGFEDILTENYDILTYQFSSEGDIFRHGNNDPLSQPNNLPLAINQCSYVRPST